MKPSGLRSLYAPFKETVVTVLEPILGFSNGFVLVAAIGLVPACRKFLLGFLSAAILIQLYLDGSVTAYQTTISETINEFFSHRQFAVGVLAGSVFGVIVAIVAAARRSPS
jgi:hypothetical protein